MHNERKISALNFIAILPGSLADSHRNTHGPEVNSCVHSKHITGWSDPKRSEQKKFDVSEANTSHGPAIAEKKTSLHFGA